MDGPFGHIKLFFWPSFKRIKRRSEQLRFTLISNIINLANKTNTIVSTLSLKILSRISITESVKCPILTSWNVSYSQLISRRLHSLVQTQCYFWLAAVMSLFRNSEFEAKLYWSKSQIFLNLKKFHFQAKWKKFEEKLQYMLW